MAERSDSPSPEERKRLNGEAKAKEEAEQATLPYKWTQTIKDVDVVVPITGNYKGRDLEVKLSKQALKVSIKGQEPIIDGQLPHTIHVDESTWTLETVPSGKEIVIHLDKVNQMEWWPHV
ncbi:hypothetical protein LTS18_011008, partial [Coniosporium uncinatum]